MDTKKIHSSDPLLPQNDSMDPCDPMSIMFDPKYAGIEEDTSKLNEAAVTEAVPKTANVSTQTSLRNLRNIAGQ